MVTPSRCAAMPWALRTSLAISQLQLRMHGVVTEPEPLIPRPIPLSLRDLLSTHPATTNSMVLDKCSTRCCLSLVLPFDHSWFRTRVSGTTSVHSLDVLFPLWRVGLRQRRGTDAVLQLRGTLRGSYAEMRPDQFTIPAVSTCQDHVQCLHGVDSLSTEGPTLEALAYTMTYILPRSETSMRLGVKVIVKFGAFGRDGSQ